MRRVPEVIDTWFDSGSMPFAQWGYPHTAGSAEKVAALKKLGGDKAVNYKTDDIAAAVKAFVGMHGGACCTSSNAGAVFERGPRREHHQ